MVKEINIDGNTYELDALPKEVIDSLLVIQNSKQKISELTNIKNFFYKAKEAYLKEITNEISKNSESKKFGDD